MSEWCKWKCKLPKGHEGEHELWLPFEIPDQVESRSVQRRNALQRDEPSVCPVCHGRGNVLHGFYNPYPFESATTTPLPERCRACGGSGVLWRETGHDPPLRGLIAKWRKEGALPSQVRWFDSKAIAADELEAALASQGSQGDLTPDTEEGLSSEQLAEQFPGGAGRRNQDSQAVPSGCLKGMGIGTGANLMESSQSWPRGTRAREFDALREEVLSVIDTYVPQEGASPFAELYQKVSAVFDAAGRKVGQEIGKSK